MKLCYRKSFSSSMTIKVLLCVLNTTVGAQPPKFFLIDQTFKYRYSLPHVDDRLSENKMFKALSLAQGYYKVPTQTGKVRANRGV